MTPDTPPADSSITPSTDDALTQSYPTLARDDDTPQATLTPMELASEFPVDPSFKSGFIALVGRPNVGKSSLLNRLVGQKVAITSPIAQTTRHRIRGVMTNPNSQIIFLDTPGLSKPLDKLGHFLVDEAQAALGEADGFMMVVDATVEPGSGDAWVIEQIKATGKPLLLILNKIDRLASNGPLRDARQKAYAHLLLGIKTHDLVMVSAKTAKNIPRIAAALEPWLTPGPRYYDDETVTDQRMREMAAELIREQVLRNTQQEIPHSVAVLIESYKEPLVPGDPVHICATLVVNQKSQKGMLIGKEGHLIKQIKDHAQKAISVLCDQPVVLECHVSVRANWRRDDQFLKQLGLAPPA
jgi:GTPase